VYARAQGGVVILAIKDGKLVEAKRAHKFNANETFFCRACDLSWTVLGGPICAMCGEKTIRFASERECERYRELLFLERYDKIWRLKRQPKFTFPMGFSYIGDFEYFLPEGQLVVEDVKGVETEPFRLKKKCMEYFFPNVELRIVK
jgi:hypothetical protein